MAETGRDLLAASARAAEAGADETRVNGHALNGHDIATNGRVDPSEGVDGVAKLTPDELKRQIDALSLEQALIDFEVANARVLDLTGRLVATSKRVVDLQAEADGLRQQIQQLQTELDAERARFHEMTTSRAYRWGNRLSALRTALRS